MLADSRCIEVEVPGKCAAPPPPPPPPNCAMIVRAEMGIYDILATANQPRW